MTVNLQKPNISYYDVPTQNTSNFLTVLINLCFNQYPAAATNP